MPSKKRGRLDSDDEEEEGGGAKLCGNGHPLVLVPKEVRRLEKDKTWSCDGDKCQLDWDGENGTLYLERARYRCVHYHSQGPCNYDLCGDCYYSSPGKEAGVRRSLRESRPSSIRREEEWQMDKRPKYSPSEMSPGRVGRRSRDGHSPGSILTNGIRKISPNKKSPTTAEVSPRRTRGGDHNRSGSRKTPNSTHSPGDHSRPRSMRARNGARNDYVEDTESTGESDLNNTKDDVDSPFFPNGHHVRFSPSAKNNQTENGRSPFGRKTRSSRRGLSSYIQSLPSEDEQSEFNRHYRSDLRRRQQRKASEEDSQEAQDTKSTRRSGRRRMDSETSGAEELSLAQRKSMRSMRRQNEKILNDEEDDSEGVGDPTVTEASLRRSSRRRGSGAAPAGEEADTESGVEKHDSEEEEAEEEEADQEAEEEEEVAEEETKEGPRLTRRSSGRQRGVVISEPDDTPVLSRSRRTNRKLSSEEEEEDEDEPEDKDLEDGELEDENEDNDESRRSSRRHRQPVNRYQPGLEEPTPRGRDGSDESSEEEEEQTSRRRATRNTKKKSPLKRRQYGLREKRNEVRRYTDTPNPNVRDQGLLRRDTNISRGGGRGRANDKDRRRRHRTGDSSSPTDSDSSDEEAFEKRKSKRMRIEMERMRPMNMSKNDVNKAVFRDRAKAGSSMADIQPMEMDMGVTFDNVGGLKEQVHSLKEMVMFPLLYPEMFKKFDIQPPRGVLFYGPPGTGKTLLARALASECSSENKKVAFFMRKGADCLSKWIGESERQLRMLFDQAYQMRPSIIFFDEIDGLAPVRSSRQDQIHSSIVSTLLALMDGLDNRGEIVVIGATNRIENIDPALRRPGRFDREFRFFLPDRKTRKEIIKLHTKTWDPPISEPLLNTLGTKTIGYCGADLKGLTAEAALNSLRRSFPQVYESNQKLAIDMNVVQVRKCDFDKALRKIVPSTHRVEDRVLGPLPKQVRPLLSQTLTNLTHHIKKIFPHCRLGKTAVLPASLTHRPRLLIVANEGQGATTYLAPALLHFMEKLPVTKLDIAALFSNSARTPEEAVTSLIHLARRTQPGILFIPHLAKLWSVSSETVRATLCTALADCPPNAPMLVLAVSNIPHHQLDESVQHLFNIHYRETYRVENPGENERREFFRPLVSACSQPPYQPPPPAPPRESLPVLPAPECRALTEREEKRLKRKEAALLRELRIFLRDIWTKIHRENKFFMFRMPVNTDEVDDYLKYVKTPMDFESMHVKLDDGEYTCAQDFLNDIDLIAENAIEYNCDLKYETNRIICHRARALQDFAYALVKAEMDTDFEDECKEIHRRRLETSDKLKKLDKDQGERDNQKQVAKSPSKLQDIMAIVSTACEVCKSKDDEDSMLLCDGCDKGYHTYCVDPPIEEVPEGDWFCPECVKNNKDKGEAGTPGSADSRRGSARARRRKSRWSSGVVPKKKSVVKKKIIQTDDEDEGGNNKDESMEVEKNEVSLDISNKDPDLTPSSPRPGTSRAQQTAPAPEAQSQPPQPQSRSEEPSVPTGVRIDQAKVLQWHNDLVRFTDNFALEKLERIYTAMAKVIRKFRTLSDRTDLPTELQAELEVVKSQEKELSSRQYDGRDWR